MKIVKHSDYFLAKALEFLIYENEWDIARNVLEMSKDTFALYDEYSFLIRKEVA
jgi:hypothetical protein